MGEGGFSQLSCCYFYADATEGKVMRQKEIPAGSSTGTGEEIWTLVQPALIVLTFASPGRGDPLLFLCESSLRKMEEETEGFTARRVGSVICCSLTLLSSLP